MFGTEKQVLCVEGMHCAHCAARVEKALTAVDGVKSAKVDLEAKTATIKTKTPIDEEKAKQAIEGAGFKFAGFKS